jgi:cyanate permease
MGTLNGLQMIVSSVVWAKYYGRQHLGAITGVVSTILVASSALGPMPFGIARDLMGSYTTILVAFATLPFLLGVANLFYGTPPVKDE